MAEQLRFKNPGCTQEPCPCGQNGDPPNCRRWLRPYRWNLVEVSDTHGNSYTVTYAATMVGLGNVDGSACGDLWEVGYLTGGQGWTQDEIDSYMQHSRPTAVEYSGGLLRVAFEYDTRPDVPDREAGCDLGPM